MAIIPIRGVGELGVISDQKPFDLPFNAFYTANNLRFDNGSVSRYSVFKKFDDTYSYSKTPIGILEGGGNEGSGYLVTVFSDGTMEERNNGVTNDVTPVASLTTNEERITTTFLGGLTYVNRPGDLPIYRAGPSNGAFTVLTGWDTSDRCDALRAYKDFLIALNVTKGATAYPAMVKWSNAAQSGVPPADWDVTDPASLAGENVLNDCRDKLVDGLTLGDSFVIYGETQTFRMDYIGQPLIFRFQKLFDDIGLMARNCAVSVDGVHYVFGHNDIVVHDGFSKKSIAQGRVLETIFSELDYNNKDKCFVYHDRMKGEVGFAYPSGSQYAPWRIEDIVGCNRAAVYNYRSDTWTFVDLPSAIGWCMTSEVSLVTWADLNNWNQVDSTWGAYEGARPSTLLIAGSGNPSLSIPGKPYFVDDLEGGRLNVPADEEVQWEAFGEWLYKDLDELQIPLYGRKLIRRIVPQFHTSNDEAVVNLQFGQSDGVNTPISWQSPYPFSPWNDRKYDTRINGRYISMKFTFPVGTDVNFGGFDADLVQISGR